MKAIHFIEGLGVIIVAGALGYWGISNSFKGRGYCDAKQRLLMDGEFVDVAVEKLVANLKQEMKTLPVGDKLNMIEYKSAQDFYIRQPDCCFGRDKKFRTFELNGPHHPNSVKVNIFYKHDYDGPRPFRSAEVLVDRCGTEAEVVSEKTDLTPFPTGGPRADPATQL